jgi:hypothetical protein
MVSELAQHLEVHPVHRAGTTTMAGDDAISYSRSDRENLMAPTERTWDTPPGGSQVMNPLRYG